MFDQFIIDQKMIQCDGTPDKSRLGANAILSVSLACLRAAAAAKGEPVFPYLGGAAARHLLIPMIQIYGGGE